MALFKCENGCLYRPGPASRKVEVSEMLLCHWSIKLLVDAVLYYYCIVLLHKNSTPGLWGDGLDQRPLGLGFWLLKPSEDQ